MELAALTLLADDRVRAADVNRVNVLATARGIVPGVHPPWHVITRGRAG